MTLYVFIPSSYTSIFCLNESDSTVFHWSITPFSISDYSLVKNDSFVNGVSDLWLLRGNNSTTLQENPEGYGLGRHFEQVRIGSKCMAHTHVTLHRLFSQCRLVSELGSIVVFWRLLAVAVAASEQRKHGYCAAAEQNTDIIRWMQKLPLSHQLCAVTRTFLSLSPNLRHEHHTFHVDRKDAADFQGPTQKGCQIWWRKKH